MGFFRSGIRALLLQCLTGVFLVAATNAAWADPPALAGRVAQVAGSAWWLDPETKAWVKVVRNQTIAEGDQLRTDVRSRVTVRVGSTTLWLDEQSDLEVAQLNDAATLLRLSSGHLALRLRTAQAAQETRVQTREGLVSPELEGLFRVSQLDRGTRLAVIHGRAQFDSDPAAPVQRAWLREGEQSEFWWADAPRIDRQSITRDKFNAWFMAQDQAEGGLASGDESYVSAEMTGAEDLNQYGNWETATDYGPVWIPTRVAAGWEPYRDGSWVWTRHWGWSWVDNAPWGFAPFHYGRWVQHRGRWAWAPGRFEPRPAYSPGLVAWVGGPQVSVGVSIGGTRRPPPTSWVPLAPRQSYVPAYPHSPQYIERFRWDGGRTNYGRPTRDSRDDPNDRDGRYRPAPVRGDAGPQPYRTAPPVAAPAAPVYGNGNSLPWNRTEGRNDRRDEGNDSGNFTDRRGEDRRNRQPIVAPAQPYQPRVDAPAYTSPNTQREPDRTSRNRAPVQSLPTSPMPAAAPVQAPQQPAPARGQAPIFNREAGWTAPLQNPRPAAAPQASVPPTPAPAQQAGPRQQPRPVDDDTPSTKRNKRDAQDRDFR
ncbi:MAG: hypothetical protein CFE44_00090 [Burkholderiales bacterium PBB4]|nr:MAG: hypothetical protein CFE44_00090 [Burkholderiales bacterium PBB4]